MGSQPVQVRAVARAALLVGVALIVGCGGGQRAAAPSGGEASDPAVAQRQVKETVQEVYGVLRRGKPEGLLPLLADPLLVVGPGGADVYASRSDAIVALTDGFRGGRKHRLTSRGLRVSAAPDGQSAWASDTIVLDGAPYAATALFALVDDIWVAIALHVARGHGDKDPAPATPSALPALPGPAADEPVRMFRAALATPAVLPEQLSENADALVIGPGPREVSRGPKAIRKMWKKKLAKAPLMTLQGEPRSGLSPDGALAWVAAVVTIPVEGEAAPVPHRLFHVYEKTAAGWRLVVAQRSLAAAAAAP
jgi:ketosteroid isomerase-like protein